MKRSELERAWPQAEPPPGFADRVLERLQQSPRASEPPLRKVRVLDRLRSRPARWLLPAVAAIALGGVLLSWPPEPERDGHVIAAEPRMLSLGERAVAELSAGAELRWSAEQRAREVEQRRGTVTYRVLPGTDFRVQTPHGSVAVLGTVFRVAVAEREAAEGEPMNKRWAIAGASAALGALLWVSVEQGSVRLSNGAEEVVLAAGQAGAIGTDGVPHRQPEAPSAPPAVEPPAVEPAAVDAAERARLRQVADTVRSNAARRRATLAQAAAKQVASQAPAEPAPPPVEFRLRKEGEAPPPPPSDPEAARRRDYLRRSMQEQYIPVARECYTELLERQPTASGKLVLEFAIVGDGDAGVVDRVGIRDEDTTIDDAEFQQCMRESLYTSVFEPPPPGARETTVVYPVEVRPD